MKRWGRTSRGCCARRRSKGERMATSEHHATAAHSSEHDDVGCPQADAAEALRSGAAQPPAQSPSLIAWTESTIRDASAGDPQRGAFIALNCTACHGEKGISTQDWIPTLAGMDRFVIYKQLADYRSGKRVGGVMGAIAEVLSPRDAADVAAYYSSLAGLPPSGGV